MGTIKLHVLQMGSGEVVKSMISKSEIYPNWKQVGLSFFVMKGPTFQGEYLPRYAIRVWMDHRENKTLA